MRANNRKNTELRDFHIERNFIKNATSSVLISMGDTKVICTASCEERVPHFLRDSGQGWVTAEYGMLPASTHTRMNREVTRGKASGRTNEIQRLIGRSLRTAIDLEKLGERSIMIDCDVIQADGGTRTASITGAMVALWDAVNRLRAEGTLTVDPIRNVIAAISVGIVNGVPMVDLDYSEDSQADVDMNVIMTAKGDFVEVQGTAEQEPFSQSQLQDMLGLAQNSIKTLTDHIQDLVQVPA